jgi:hypothetical protein
MPSLCHCTEYIKDVRGPKRKNIVGPTALNLVHIMNCIEPPHPPPKYAHSIHYPAPLSPEVKRLSAD